MNVQRTAPNAFTATFETEEAVHDEHQTNLSLGALRLPTPETAPLHTPVTVTLRGPSGGEVETNATVVALLPDGLALAIDGDPEERLRRLLARPADARENSWDRMRGLSQMEKILLAVKADRTERALLLQDNDPRVLLSLLRNPRLTVDEVVRVAKSPYLTFQIADVVMKATQWMASIDVRLGLIHNPKTPPAFALRILPTLPDVEVRNVARAGTSMALKQAALRRLQQGK
jgi:hypothetical protein